MKWYSKVLAKNKKEIVRSAVISIVITFGFSIWYFIASKGFEWQSISPIEVPILPLIFWSALVFVTSGAFLFRKQFYLFLHFIFVRALGNRELHKGVKKIIWIFLIIVTIYAVTKLVDLLNAGISFFYNMAILVLYLSPPLGVFLFVFAVIIFLKRLKPRHNRG